jgi:hypothetical protein
MQPRARGMLASTMDAQNPEHPGGARFVQRRRYPRLEVSAKIHGHDVPLNIPITVLDISLGGVSIQTEMTFPIGELHEFRFTPVGGEPLVIAARVVHSLRATGLTGALCYFSGLEFVVDTPDARLAVENLMATLSAP